MLVIALSGPSVLHLKPPSNEKPMLGIVLGFAGLGSFLVVALAVAAFARRRSRSYLLILFALSMLLIRTVLGEFDALREINPYIHHLLEHASDGVMAVLLLGAVYYARTAQPEWTDKSEPDLQDNHE